MEVELAVSTFTNRDRRAKMASIEIRGMRSVMRLRFFTFFLLAAFAAGCVSYEARQVKTYQSELQPMLGRSESDVTALITQTWKFGLLNRWAAVNPSVETVLKNNFRTFGFSKTEAAEIFAEPGDYKVMIFTKPLSREELQTGQIDSLGGNIIGTNERAQSATHGYIRIVLKDGKLVHCWVGS
jgi:hypothetical protein